jgi:preprotein translocase subunit SecF
MVEFAVPEIDYTRYSNRQLAAVPLAVLGVALVVVLGWYVMTGSPVELGMAFTGGTEVRFTTGESLTQVQQTFSGAQVEAIRPVGTGDTYILETQAPDIENIERIADQAGYTITLSQSVSASLGAAAQGQAIFGLALAFAGMGALVFVLFRTFVPSIAVIVSAFSDIMIPLAVMNVFGIELSLGTVAALLMLIGYSVDSDILLNNHILRRRGGFYESAYRAMRTGVTMTLTSIAAMIVMTITATLLAIPLLPQIGVILVIGLSADLMNTYMLNMSLLRWYKYEGVNA